MEDINKSKLREYLSDISSFSNKTVYRKTATIKAFFNYHEKEDNIEITPFHKLRFQKYPKAESPNTLTLSQIDKLFNYAYLILKREGKGKYKHQEHIRNIAVLELLFTTGIRVSELCDLRISNIQKEYSLLLIETESSHRVLYIENKETRKALENYYNLFQDKIKTYFFINRLGKQISTQSIRLMIIKLGKEAKIPAKVSPRIIRHTFAKLMGEMGVSLTKLNNILGHKQITSTQIYSPDNNNNRLYSKNNPRNLIHIKNKE